MNKKGFTLIEIIAVLVVLSVIMFITVPVVNDVISESRKNTFKISLESLLKVAKNDYQGNVRYGKVTYTLNENTLVCTSGCPEGQINIKYKGDTEDANGDITIDGSDISMDIETNVYKASYKQEKCKIESGNYNGKEYEGYSESKEKCTIVEESLEDELCGASGNGCTIVEHVFVEEKLKEK